MARPAALRLLRHRRVAVALGAALLTIAVAIPTVLAVTGGGSDDDLDVSANASPTTTTAEDATTTTDTTEPVEPSVPGAAPTETQDTTTTALVCRNSSNPACGPFRWDPPPPPNRPMEIELVGLEPEHPVAGQPFTIRLEVTDWDTFVLGDECWNLHDWGDGTVTAGHGVGDGSEPCDPEITDEYCQRAWFGWHYGPWDPPGTPGGDTTHFVDEIEHTYAEPGTYTATFTYPSRYFVAHECADPFEETGTFRTTITVG